PRSSPRGGRARRRRRARSRRPSAAPLGEHDARAQPAERLAARLGRRAVEHQHAVEVVGLVLDAARRVAVEVEAHVLAVLVEARDHDVQRALNRDGDPLDREAALVGDLGLVAPLDDLGVRERVDLLVVLRLEDEDAAEDADLRGREADPVRVAHQQLHPVDEALQLVVELLDGARLHAERGVRILADLRERDAAASLALRVELLVADLALDLHFVVLGHAVGTLARHGSARAAGDHEPGRDSSGDAAGPRGATHPRGGAGDDSADGRAARAAAAELPPRRRRRDPRARRADDLDAKAARDRGGARPARARARGRVARARAERRRRGRVRASLARDRAPVELRAGEHADREPQPQLPGGGAAADGSADARLRAHQRAAVPARAARRAVDPRALPGRPRRGTPRGVIRLLEPRDGDDLAALYRANWDFLQPFEPARDDGFFTGGVQRRRIERMRDGDYWLWGIHDGGPLVGMISLSDVFRGPLQMANVG